MMAVSWIGTPESRYRITVGNPMLGAVWFALVALRCGGTSVSSPPAVTVDQACGDRARAFCTKLASCGAAEVALRYGDEATCEAREQAACTASLGASGTSSTPAFEEQCVAAYANFACPDFFANNPPSDCRPSPGALATGAACSFNAQCQSTFCSIPKGAACGVCGAVPQAGDACADASNCGFGLYCDKGSQTCATSVVSGAACGKQTQCAYGLACIGATDTAKGTCQAVVQQEGAACASSAAKGPACDRSAGLVCNDMSQCVKATVAGANDTCGQTGGGAAAICGAGGRCDVAAKAKAGTCVAAVDVGAACDTAGTDSCITGARCVGTPDDGGVKGICSVPGMATCE